jgi:hypothetical protein
VLIAQNCKIQSVNLSGLESLEYLNLSGNALTVVPKLRALTKVWSHGFIFFLSSSLVCQRATDLSLQTCSW